MFGKLMTYIYDSRVFHALTHFLKSIRFKKQHVSLYDIIKIFLKQITKDEILERANGVAFNFTLAIFPAIIFLFTLTPYITNYIPDVNHESIMDFIGQLMPETMFSVVRSTVMDIISKTRGGLLTFGALFSLYLATNGMMSLIKAFNSCYKTVEKRGFFKTRLIATGLTVMLAFTLILAIVLLIVGNLVIDFMQREFSWLYLQLSDYDFFLILSVRFLVIFIVFFLAISFMYYFGPAVHFNWHFFSIGSIIATFLCLAVSYGFSYYITNFANYNKLYGSIGVLIALMIWQMILSVILLVGYEINAAIHQAYLKVPLSDLPSEEEQIKK